MPTNRRRRAPFRHEDLSPALYAVLTEGHYPKRVAPDFTAFQLWGSCIRGRPDGAVRPTFREVWTASRERIMADWLEQHAGSRPAGWWMCEAGEPRRVLSGAEWLDPFPTPEYREAIWRSHFGILRFVPNVSPTIESEASYLLRLNRLEPGERRRIPKCAFAPEAVFEDDPSDHGGRP